MKLITHNILMCNKAGCTSNNFPLKLVANNVKFYEEAALMEYSKPLMQRLLQKLDLGALQHTLMNDLKWQDVKPVFMGNAELTENPKLAKLEELAEDEAFLMNLWEMCVHRHITEGHMLCNNCGRQYDIKNGIVNMLLNEDEV